MTPDHDPAHPDGASNRLAAAQSRAAQIADRARERNRARSDELASWVHAGRARGLTEQERGTATDLAHQLAGSAGTFGYQHATDVARELERLLTSDTGARDWDRAEECVAAIARSLERGPDAFDSEE